MKDFESWLNDELNKEYVHEHYDSDGDSSRAVLTRWRKSKIKSLCWGGKRFVSFLKDTASSFDGIDTPIGWFLLWPVSFVILPISPILMTIYYVRRSKKDYLQHYKELMDFESHKHNYTDK